MRILYAIHYGVQDTCSEQGGVAIKEQGIPLRKGWGFKKLGFMFVLLAKNRLPQIYQLRNNAHFHYLSFHGQDSGTAQWSPLLRVSQGYNQRVSQAAFLSGVQTFLPSLWVSQKYLVSCGCRTEVPILLFAIGQGPFSAAEAFLRSLSYSPIHSSFITWQVTSSRPASESL